MMKMTMMVLHLLEKMSIKKHFKNINMQNNLLPAIIPTFRIKEYNSAYDRIFGLGRG